MTHQTLPTSLKSILMGLILTLLTLSQAFAYNPDPRTNLDLDIIGVSEENEDSIGGYVGVGQTHTPSSSSSNLCIKVFFFCKTGSFENPEILTGNEKVTLAITSGSSKIQLTPCDSSGTIQPGYHLNAATPTKTWDIAQSGITTFVQYYRVSGLEASDSLKDITFQLSHDIPTGGEEVGTTIPDTSDTVSYTVVGLDLTIDSREKYQQFSTEGHYTGGVLLEKYDADDSDEETLIALQANTIPSDLPFGSIDISEVRCNYLDGNPRGDTTVRVENSHTADEITSATIPLASDQTLYIEGTAQSSVPHDVYYQATLTDNLYAGKAIAVPDDKVSITVVDISCIIDSSNRNAQGAIMEIGETADLDINFNSNFSSGTLTVSSIATTQTTIVDNGIQQGSYTYTLPTYPTELDVKAIDTSTSPFDAGVKVEYAYDGYQFHHNDPATVVDVECDIDVDSNLDGKIDDDDGLANGDDALELSSGGLVSVDDSIPLRLEIESNIINKTTNTLLTLSCSGGSDHFTLYTNEYCVSSTSLTLPVSWEDRELPGTIYFKGDSASDLREVNLNLSATSPDWNNKVYTDQIAISVVPFDIGLEVYGIGAYDSVNDSVTLYLNARETGPDGDLVPTWSWTPPSIPGLNSASNNQKNWSGTMTVDSDTWNNLKDTYTISVTKAYSNGMQKTMSRKLKVSIGIGDVDGSGVDIWEDIPKEHYLVNTKGSRRGTKTFGKNKVWRLGLEESVRLDSFGTGDDGEKVPDLIYIPLVDINQLEKQDDNIDISNMRVVTLTTAHCKIPFLWDGTNKNCIAPKGVKCTLNVTPSGNPMQTGSIRVTVPDSDGSGPLKKYFHSIDGTNDSGKIMWLDKGAGDSRKHASYYYDAQGRLIKSVDYEGDTLFYYYHTHNEVLYYETADYGKVHIYNEPYEEGLLACVWDANDKHKVFYRYDENQNLLWVTQVFGKQVKTTEYTYHQNGLVDEEYLPGDKRPGYSVPSFDYDYDEDGNVNSVSKNGETTEYDRYTQDDEEFDTSINIGKTSSLDKAVRMVRTTSPSGAVEDVYYNMLGDVVATKLTDPVTGDVLVTENKIDSSQRNYETVDPSGVVGKNDYLNVDPTSCGLQVAEYFNSKVTSTTLGCDDAQLSVGGPILYTYEPVYGKVKTMTDSSGNTTTYYYDYEEGGKTAAIERFNDVHNEDYSTTDTARFDALMDALDYDPLNFLGSDINGDGFTTGTYGDVIKTVLPPAIKTGETTATLNQSQVMTYYHDGTGREGLIKDVINSDGVKTAYEYDEDGNLTKQIQDADYSGRPSSLDEANEVIWQYEYDEYGNKTKETNPRGISTGYEYDAWGQLTTITLASAVQDPGLPGDDIPDLEAFGFTTVLEYDEKGQIIGRSVEDRHATSGCGNTLDSKAVYNEKGLLVEEWQEIDANTSSTLRYYYDDAGRRVLTVGVDGTATYVEYDAFNRVVKTTDGLTSLNQLSSTQLSGIQDAPTSLSTTQTGSPLNRITHYNDRNLVDSIDEFIDGTTTTLVQYEYDAFGRKTSEIFYPDKDPRYQAGSIFVYDDELDRITDVITIGALTDDATASTATLSQKHFEYDNLGRVVQTSQRVYMPDGSDDRLSSRTLVLEGGVLAGSGGAGENLVPATGDWVASQIIYDDAGRTSATINDDGQMTRYEYDALGRLIKTIDPQGNIYETWYDSNSNVVETRRTDVATTGTVSAETFTTTMYYDSLNRIVTQVDSDGRAQDLRYDSLGRVVAVADTNGADTDGRTLNRLGSTTETLSVNDYGNVSLSYYDGLGRVVKQETLLTSSTAGDGVNIGRSTTGEILTIPTVDTTQGGGDGVITNQYQYDEAGRLIALTDDDGNTTQWGYDALGRKTSEVKGLNDDVDPTGINAPTTKQWTYNDDGTLASQTKPDGQVLDYDYDDNKRVTSITSGTQTLQEFRYDSMGRQVWSRDYNVSDGQTPITVDTSRVYDSLGRVIEESTSVAGGTPQTVTYQYEGMQLTAMVYPDGRTVYYDYNENGTLKTVSDNNDLTDPIAQYDYIGDRILSRDMQNGVNLDLTEYDANGDPTGSTLYDSLGRAEEWTHLNTNDVNSSGTAATLIGYQHDYDQAGNKTSQLSLHDTKDNQTYEYDSLGRLVGYDRGDSAGQTWDDMASSQDWSLDGLGNWDTVDTTTEGNTATETRDYTTSNAAASISDGSTTTTLSYDANGNMQAKGDYDLAWDAFDRLAAADDTAVNTTDGKSIRYLYDTNNRRIGVVTEDLATGTTTNQLYNYAGWQVLEEVSASTMQTGDASATIGRQFVYGNSLDEILVMDTDADADGSCLGTQDSRLYYHQNTLGSVAGLTDASGNLVEAYQYDPYGNHVLLTDGDGDGIVEFDASDTRSTTTTSSVSNPYAYTGRRYDGDTELYYYRNRYYDDTLGRFISPDPLGYDDGPNTYNYVGNDPTSAVDPMGLLHRTPLTWQGMSSLEELMHEHGLPSLIVLDRMINAPNMNWPHKEQIIHDYKMMTDRQYAHEYMIQVGMPPSLWAGQENLKNTNLGSALLDPNPGAGRRLVHAALDAGGFVPVIGVASDLLNSYLYLSEGDAFNATLSLGATVAGTGIAAYRVTAISRFGARTASSWDNLARMGDNYIDDGAEMAYRRSLKMPSVDNKLAGTSTMGYTDPAGSVFLKPGLSRMEQVHTLRHESVHAFLSAKGSGTISTFRQNICTFGYSNSQLLRFTEEAMAETYASGSLLKGLKHPFHPGYKISVRGLITEGTIASVAFIGTSYLGYQILEDH